MKFEEISNLCLARYIKLSEVKQSPGICLGRSGDLKTTLKGDVTMAKGKRVFISHPLMSEGTPAENYLKVDAICKRALQQGVIPLSPLHLFGFVETETPELRVEILEVCKRMIEMSDEVWSYGDQGGCALEKVWAEQCRIPVKDMRG